jgi:hypothetical protein
MFYVINESNQATFDAPEWADTPDKALTAAAAAVAVGRGNLTLTRLSHYRIRLTDSHGISQTFVCAPSPLA